MSLSPILMCPSPDRWLAQALSDVDTLLHDHAHCEKKAASSMLSLVFRFPDPEMAVVLSRMAREELGHFELALREMKRRNVVFGKLHPSAYAEQLAKPVRRKVPELALLDTLLVSALIEARSNERIALLAQAIDDPHLRLFYETLHPAEDRHWRLMLDLAARQGDYSERLALFAQHEAELITTGEAAVRMHS